MAAAAVGLSAVGSGAVEIEGDLERGPCMYGCAVSQIGFGAGGLGRCPVGKWKVA